MQKRLLGKTGYEVSAIIYGGIVSAANYGDQTYEDGKMRKEKRYKRGTIYPDKTAWLLGFPLKTVAIRGRIFRYFVPVSISR